MRIHIWTASIGAGHNEAARVLQQEWRTQGHTAEIYYPLETGPHLFFKLGKNGYKLLVTWFPSLWRHLSEKKLPVQSAVPPGGWWPETIRTALDADAVVSVHPILTALAASAKGKCPNIKLFHAATDYWHVPAANLPEVDGVFLPKQVGTDHPASPVMPFGIPAYFQKSPFSKKECCLANGWDPEKPLILMSGGGEGPFPYQKLLRATRNLHPLCTIVLCSGKWKEPRRMVMEGHDVFLYPWRKEFKNYLQICDVLVTKAGGMTLTEAFLYETPVVITAPLPGQEEKNARYALCRQAARQGNCPDTVWKHVSTLLQSPFERERMKRRQKRLQQPDSVKRITQTVCRVVTASGASAPYIPQVQEQRQAESAQAGFFQEAETSLTKE
ncbi:glycosyltransferase [Salibacterium qingdaonense]|nr:glycosyltransferase [Salibacterium qingdaonense]